MERHTIMHPISDFVMFDRRQEQIFDAVGEGRDAFSNTSRWPWLHKVLMARARKVLHDSGIDEWNKRGGEYDGNNEPTFGLRSPTAGEVVRSIAACYGGLRYFEQDGIPWAVRLMPDRSDKGDVLLGLAISLPGDLHIAGHHFHRHAQQTLWQIFHQVRVQGSSIVTVDAEQLATILWGGHRRPKNWRHAVFNTIISLMHLHLQVLHILPDGWRPRPRLHAVAVAGVEVDHSQRPNRFMIEIGRCFLGALHHYGRLQDGRRVFNFNEFPNKEAKAEIEKARKAGQLVTVSIPAKLLGPARWSGLTPHQRGIVDGIIKEVTRTLRKREPKREDNADILTGNTVPGATAKSRTPCLLLTANRQYVAFNGNGHRHGLGYGIVGGTGTGWLCKCGYAVPPDPKALRREIRKFLADLETVAGILGLTAVGFRKDDAQWLSLSDLRAMAGSRDALGRFDPVMLRVYGPPNYADGLRRYFEQRGQLHIPAPGVATVTDSMTGDQISQLVRQKGISQSLLAEHLGCSRQFVSDMLSGKKAWPAEKIAQAVEFLSRIVE